MAKINPLQEQVTFQGSAKGGTFDPYNVPNPNAGLDGKLAAINQSFENIKEGQRLKDNENTRYLEQLSKFSETLTETVAQGVKFYADYEEEQANMLFAEDQRAQELAKLQLEKDEQTITDIDSAHTQQATNLIKQGAPPEIVERMKDLGGLRGYYYKRNAAVAAGKGWEAYITDKMSNDDTPININGVEKPANSPEWDPPELAFIMKRHLQNYYKESGLSQVSRGFQAKYALPNITGVESKLMGKFRLAYAIRKSDENRVEATNTLFGELAANKDSPEKVNVGLYIDKLANTYDERGNPIGRAGAWKMLANNLIVGVESGQIDSAQIEKLLSSPDPVTGKSLAVSRQLWAFDLKSKLAAANRANFANEEAEDKQRGQQFVREVLADFNSNPGAVSEEAIHMAQRRFFELTGSKSPELETYQSSFSMSAENKRVLDERFTFLAEQGELTPEQVKQAPLDLQDKWLTRAQKQADATDGSKIFRDKLKAIERQVLDSPGVKTGTEGDGVATLIVESLQSKFRRKVAEYVATGKFKDADEAALYAVSEVIKEFETNKRYAIDKYGKFSNFMPKDTLARSISLNNKLNNIRSKLKNNGITALDTVGGLIFNKAELQAMEKGYGQPGWSVPPAATYWGAKLKRSPLEIINRQRNAAGLKPLATPQSLERVRNTIPSSFQAILLRYPSVNRSTRGLGSAGAYDPVQVPKGYGPVVQQAAKANNIDPSILAGLIEAESTWNANAVSKRGARGIAQIMPEYHPGFTQYNDPVASINYAAKYLSQLQRQFGGNLQLAIIAYNAGPGNVERYRGPIPGNAESQGYYKKVMKGAYKYGYGQALRDPSMIRPGVVSSVTFDSGQPGIDVFFENKKFTSVLPGRVKEVGNQTNAQGGGYGNYVVVESIDPLTNRPVDVLYAHLDSINVQEGQRLNAGSVLGRQGGTGRVVSADGTIASIDFFAPRPKGSKDMTPYSGYQQLRSHIANKLRKG